MGPGEARFGEAAGGSPGAGAAAQSCWYPAPWVADAAAGDAVASPTLAALQEGENSQCPLVWVGTTVIQMVSSKNHDLFLGD